MSLLNGTCKMTRRRPLERGTLSRDKTTKRRDTVSSIIISILLECSTFHVDGVDSKGRNSLKELASSDMSLAVSCSRIARHILIPTPHSGPTWRRFQQESPGLLNKIKLINIVICLALYSHLHCLATRLCCCCESNAIDARFSLQSKNIAGFELYTST
jgi:hypothetical protein